MSRCLDPSVTAERPKELVPCGEFNASEHELDHIPTSRQMVECLVAFRFRCSCPVGEAITGIARQPSRDRGDTHGKQACLSRYVANPPYTRSCPPSPLQITQGGHLGRNTDGPFTVGARSVPLTRRTHVVPHHLAQIEAFAVVPQRRTSPYLRGATPVPCSHNRGRPGTTHPYLLPLPNSGNGKPGP